jgi:hypothetical protein
MSPTDCLATGAGVVPWAAIVVVADAGPEAPEKGLTVTTNAATPAAIIATAAARVLEVDIFFICRAYF